MASPGTPGEDEGLRGARVGGALAQGHCTESGVLENEPALCLWCSGETAPPPREVIRSPQAVVPCTLRPKPRKNITQGPCYLKKEGKNLATQAPNNNQQLANLFFLNCPEVAMVTRMRSSRAFWSKGWPGAGVKPRRRPGRCGLAGPPVSRLARGVGGSWGTAAAVQDRGMWCSSAALLRCWRQNLSPTLK